MMRQLLDVVNQAVQMPLRVHLGLRAQREAVQALVVAQIGEHGLDDGDAPPVELRPRRCRSRVSCARYRAAASLVLLEERHLTGLRAFADSAGIVSRSSQGTQSRLAPWNL